MTNLSECLKYLGHKATDTVTGFKGVCDSVSVDLFGCVQVSLRPAVNDKGEIPDGRWFDINRLEITSKKPVMQPVEPWQRPLAAIPGPADKPARRD